jgi:hypothetical protein
MNDKIEEVINEMRPIFAATESALQEWAVNPKSGCVSLPILTGMVAVRLNWNETEVRENEPIIRAYVKKNSDWFITRGANGGIMPITRKQEKDAALVAKAAAKAKVAAEMAKVAAIVEEKLVEESDDEDIPTTGS